VICIFCCPWEVLWCEVPSFSMADAGSAATGILALAASGVPFDEVRVSRKGEAWNELKKTLGAPYDQLPVLKMTPSESSSSTCVLAQSNAINRICGRRAGMMPTEDPLRFAKIDEILCSIQDVKQKFIPSMLIPDPEKKRAVRNRLVNNAVNPWLRSLEALLSKNSARFGQSFAVGPTLSIADLALDCLMAWLESSTLIGVDKERLVAPEELVQLTAVRRSVEAHPGVRARREGKPEIRRAESDWVLQKVYTADMTSKLVASANPYLDQILQCFEKFDFAGEGVISSDDLKAVLAKLDVFSREELEVITTWADESGDGKVNYRDFVTRLHKEFDEDDGESTSL